MTKRWTETEDQYIRDNYARMTPKALGERLGRTTRAVAARVWSLGVRLTKQQRGRRIHDAYWRKLP